MGILNLPLKHWYFYLHTNGDVIGKNPACVESDPEYFNSPFVKAVRIQEKSLTMLAMLMALLRKLKKYTRLIKMNMEIMS